VAVEDDDFDQESQTFKDTLRSRWFIQPNPQYTHAPGQIVLDGNYVPASDTLVRKVEAPPTLITELANLTVDKDYRVEVWVTDGEFVEYADPPPGGLRVERPQLVQMPDGSKKQDVAYYDSFQWLVTIKTGCP